ncbi:MAG TPA: site-specific DNA-methyltransferase [Polyangiaceae bacterium]|jgi:site-specific DNA-methyltransferase (adenine-specific)|nr:site-specific DNA-methyltransferase [Polyangiaceae bacterium]
MNSFAPVRLDWPGRRAPRPAPPAELELVHEGHPKSHVILGDNLAAMDALHKRGARCALVYFDPPFFTGREHALVSRRRAQDGTIERELLPGFDDRWNSLDEYLSTLLDRIALARELLLPEGCLVLHVDPKTSHYLKVLCDEVFGARCFASEIVWRYRRWPAKTRNFQRVHDVLLRYVRDAASTPRFHQLYEPLAASTLATWGDRRQRAVVDASGKRLRSSSTREASPGTPLGDVWDIGIVAPVARERTGYPTQKPEALITRLLEALTEPGDLVLDPYLGSGTTLAVCARNGRHAIGIDQSRRAVQITRKRLAQSGLSPLHERVVELDLPLESVG